MKLRFTPAMKRALGALFIVAAAAFLARTVVRNWRQLGAVRWSVDPLRLAVSVAALVCVFAWGVWVWSRVQRRFDHPDVPLPALMRIWFLSNLARYLPGMQLVAVAQLSRSAGLAPAVLLTSALVHNGLSLLSAFVVAGWTLPEHLFPALDPRWTGAITTAAAVALVHPATLNYPLALVRRLTGKEIARWEGTWMGGVELLAISVVSWGLYGFAYYLFLDSLVRIPIATAIPLGGVNALSTALGILSPAPGGGGVREVAMQRLLGPFFPAAVAAVLSVAARLWNIAGEVIGGLLVLWTTGRAGRE